MTLLRAAEGRRDRARHPAARDVRAGRGRPADPRLGLARTARSAAPSSACSAEGKSVAHAHLRYLNPFPANTGEVLSRYRTVLIPEINLGQLAMLLRATYLVDAVSYNRVRGKPFRIQEIVDEAERLLGDGARA